MQLFDDPIAGEPWAVLCGNALDVLRKLPDRSVQSIVTSPPFYALRSYLAADDPAKAHEIGNEESHEAFIAKLVDIFREARRVLRDDGTLWVNMGDSWFGSGVNDGSTNPGMSKAWLRDQPKQRATQRKVKGSKLKPKDMIMIPARLAIALQADGWWLRSDIIWRKPNPMPESVADRPTKSHEHIFLLAKSKAYFYDQDAIREPTRNKADVWTVPARGFKGAHFATFPPKLIEPCILAGTSARGCCPACRSPWVQVIKVVRLPGSTPTKGDGGTTRRRNPTSRDHGAARTHAVRTPAGWKPGCKCNAGDPVPCLVLDPFAGAGTTGVVATKLGRRFIGIELNGASVGLATDRILYELARVEPVRRKRIPPARGQLLLFPGLDPQISPAAEKLLVEEG